MKFGQGNFDAEPTGGEGSQNEALTQCLDGVETWRIDELAKCDSKNHEAERIDCRDKIIREASEKEAACRQQHS